MGKLSEFATRVKELLSIASREPHWDASEAARYMNEVAMRRESFSQLSVRLNAELIQPRLETLVGFFSNASLTADEPASRCSCRFGYCERFPSSTKISLSVEHDVAYENVVVCFEASMMPAFIKLNDRDKLIFHLDQVKDVEVTQWVEERLLEFLQAYLRIDRGTDDFEEDAVSDIVCGMRMSRSHAVSSRNINGIAYFFCSTQCAERFDADPNSFLQTSTDTDLES